MTKLTKKEMEFTVKEMINHIEFLIDEVNEYNDALALLKELKLVINKNEKTAVDYWISASDPFGFDLERTKHFLCADDSDTSKMLEQIFDKVLK